MTRSTQHDHAALAAILTRQFQVISRSQVMAHGMTTSALHQRLRAGGPWQRLLPGVFLAVTGTPTTEQRSLGALPYTGTGVVPSLAAVRAVVAAAVQLGTCPPGALAAELQAGPIQGSALLRTAVSDV